MHRPLIRLLPGAVLIVLAAPALSADPPEQLPPPRALPSETVPAPVHPAMPHMGGYYREDRRAVWQYYQVDRYSQWRPVVIMGPYGSYYLYNGQPYPWASLNNRYIIPTVVGTPYRSD